MKPVRPHTLTASLLALICLPANSAAGTSLQASDTVVRMARQPVHPGLATLVEELRIGVADGAEEYMLGDVADIVLARDGSIYVLDRQVPAVRHYDAQGKFLRTIGRSGQGPGEFRSASGLALTKDGRLLLWDTGNWRINVYSATGDVLPQWTTPSGTSGSSTSQFSRAILVDTAGLVSTRKSIFNIRDVGNHPTVWLRYRPDGTFIDTLRAPPASRELPLLTATAGNVRISNPVPFAPSRIVVMSPLGYFVTGLPDRYAFEIHRPGRQVISVRRDVRAEPVSRAERAEARAAIEERMRQTDPNWSWNGPDIPDTKPFYAGIQVGLDGRIWVAIVPENSPRVGGLSGTSGVGPGVRRPPPPAVDREPPRPALYDVFEPDGVYLGQVQVPARVSSVLRRGDQVWGVAVDTDDVPRIKRYRIAWPR